MLKINVLYATIFYIIDDLSCVLLGLGILLYSIAAFYDLYPIDRAIFVICKLYICVQNEAKVCSLLL